ncbi:MAG: cytochrome c maturation protein CcmE [Armatimonadetes bacterium]|nr:MAG: cytochrome c maturation protein CcmE [Armatimonadota bacterium]
MRRYARFVIPAVVIVAVLVFLLVNLSASLVYYNTPAEVQERAGSAERLRLGGRVAPDSVVDGGTTVTFTVEDCDTDVTVIHTGVPPQLFQEGIGVVVEGTWDGTAFESDTMLVKHDEQYRSDDEHYDTERHSCSDA